MGTYLEQFNLLVEICGLWEVVIRLRGKNLALILICIKFLSKSLIKKDWFNKNAEDEK